MKARAGRAGAVLLALLAAGSASAHDLFFRPRPYRPDVNDPVEVRVLSGTFSRSENAIKRERLADLSLVDAAGRRALAPTLWSEDEPESSLSLRFEQPGTYVIGAALHPRPLALPAREFNAYLAEEGLEPILALRKKQGRLQEGSRERYTKFLKTILQLGPPQGDLYATVFGYGAEIVPLENPAAVLPGGTLRVRCLVDGQPLRGAALFAGGRRPNSDMRLPTQRLQTDADGVALVRVTAPGEWYVKFVHMSEVQEPEVAYDSKWATLSFAVPPARGR
jgi:hypothetical protein